VLSACRARASTGLNALQSASFEDTGALQATCH
jgi:hypothetical protein